MEKNDNDIVIIGAVRTPFGRFGGMLKSFPSIELGSIVIKEVLKMVNLPGEEVGEIFYGSCEPMEYGMEINVPARQALLKAGLPANTLSMTIDTACCSSMDAIDLCVRSLKLGRSKICLAVGSENMCRQSYYAYPSFRWGGARGDIVLRDPIRRGGHYPIPGVNPVSVDAGKEAVSYGVDRREQDEWAYYSQIKYKKAYEDGKFKEEMIAPFEIPQDFGGPGFLEIDEQHRPDTSLEKLAKLPTVYGSPTITPGNAPGINVGAAAILFMTRAKAQERGLPPLARVEETARMAGEPNKIASAPAFVIQKVLSGKNMRSDQIDLYEINEAFAAMPLVSSKVLAAEYRENISLIHQKMNVNGGAIAIGHPVGASGARLVMTLMYELRRRKGKFGIAAICGGLAQSTAVLIHAE